MFANLLLDAGQDSYVYQNLWTKDGSKNGGAIKYDLEWVINNWQSNGCDLWEEIRDTNFFWNRMAFAYSLGLASKLATRLGDSSSASKYQSTKEAIEATLDGMKCSDIQVIGRALS
jgi:GH15 family glucan-1,4-alpha-glucosidase